MEDETMAPALQGALYESAVMDPGVVTEDRDLAVTEQLTTQGVEVAHEQSGGAPLFGEPRGDDQRSRAPVERAGQVAFLIRAGGGDRGLLTAAPPHRANLRVGGDIDFVLADGNLGGRQRRQELAQGLPLGFALGIPGADDRPGPPPHDLLAVEP